MPISHKVNISIRSFVSNSLNELNELNEFVNSLNELAFSGTNSSERIIIVFPTRKPSNVIRSFRSIRSTASLIR